MKSTSKTMTIEIEGELFEGTKIDVVMPETLLEEHFMLAFLRTELKQDLGEDTADTQPDRFARFLNMCEDVRYATNGVFSVMGREGKHANLFIHSQHLPMQHKADQYEFEVLWETGGVVRSLDHESAVEYLLAETDAE